MLQSRQLFWRFYPVDSGLTKVFPRDWRLLVNSTPCAAGMFLMWVHKSRHARERDHERHVMAMCVVWRDLQSADAHANDNGSESASCGSA
jgi:hypothetical protein